LKAWRNAPVIENFTFTVTFPLSLSFSGAFSNETPLIVLVNYS